MRYSVKVIPLFMGNLTVSRVDFSERQNPSITSCAAASGGMETDMKRIEIYTDGACRGNPGRGGWGAILVYGGREKELSGGEAMTTNNHMELSAVIAALSALKEPCEVTLTTDSQYVVNAIEKGWLASWKQNRWRKSDKSAVLNVDLWEELYALTREHEVTFHKVAGHADNELNNRCDELARGAIAELKKTLPPSEPTEEGTGSSD